MEASLQTPTNSSETIAPQDRPALPTFLDHIHELRGRLFWIAVIFIIASAAAYPFRDVIISFLVAPLKGQELYYLTPIGGFSFIIKICTYVGAILTLPAIIFHLYRYLQPAVGKIRKRVVFSYVLFSTFLALAGVSFAYFVSLPAALYFLTGLDLTSVTAMLTVDAYYSFIMTYMIGAAVLFQLPLLLLIINSITPLKPSKLMGYQRHVILGAFVVAAIISPTPDMTNQALLAAPVIVMYQVGILLVWLRNLTKRTRNNKKQQQPAQAVAAHRTAQDNVPVESTDNELAWIDDLLLAHDSKMQVYNVATPTASKTFVAPLSSAAQTSVATQAPTAASLVVQKVALPSRGHSVDGIAKSRSIPRRSMRPLPTVHRGVTSSNGTTNFASSVQKAAPTKPTGPVRYLDGVSVPLQNIV